MSNTILVVDDNIEIRELIEIYLINEGYRVILAEDGIDAINKLNDNDIDLIILDIMMPKLDGIKACLKIREKKKLPIILLSAKSEDCDKILGLNVGADDYVTKPFNPIELMARVKSQLRRYIEFSGKSDSKNLIIDNLEINKDSREVYVDGEFVRLTPIEFNILDLLIENRGRVLSNRQIYENVWDEPYFNASNIVASHIKNIREKIEINPKNPEFIKLVWGVGYKFDK